jgi:hypothetical protein
MIPLGDQQHRFTKPFKPNDLAAYRDTVTAELEPDFVAMGARAEVLHTCATVSAAPNPSAPAPSRVTNQEIDTLTADFDALPQKMLAIGKKTCAERPHARDNNAPNPFHLPRKQRAAWERHLQRSALLREAVYTAGAASRHDPSVAELARSAAEALRASHDALPDVGAHARKMLRGGARCDERHHCLAPSGARP